MDFAGQNVVILLLLLLFCNWTLISQMSPLQLPVSSSWRIRTLGHWTELGARLLDAQRYFAVKEHAKEYNGQWHLCIYSAECQPLTVGVFVDVGFLADHQVRNVVQILQQVLVPSTALLINQLHPITVAIIHNARVLRRRW